MNTRLKAAIEEVIDAVIQDHAEEDVWVAFIHDKLAAQMTNAAEQVFDAAQDAQEFAEAQRE